MITSIWSCSPRSPPTRERPSSPSPSVSVCRATRCRRAWPGSSASGVFLSYERAISSSALGFPIEAFISVIVRQAELPRITVELARVPEIVHAHGLSGQVDLLVRVACRDTQHLFDTDARILAIEGVERTETSLVMGEVISHRVAPLMELARRQS